MTQPYDVAGEDFDYVITGGIAASGAASGVVIDTSTGFRPTYARQSLRISHITSGNTQLARFNYWSQSDFWMSVRVNYKDTSTTAGVLQTILDFFSLLDTSGIPRLIIRASAPSSSPTLPTWNVQTITGAGVRVSLVNSLSGSSTINNPFSNNPSSPDKIDIDCSYGVSGHLNIYVNGGLWFSFNGDLTAGSGVGALGGVRLKTIFSGYVSGTVAASDGCAWSELIVNPTDTRSLSLVTFPPVANGVTDGWTGSASDVNEQQLNDATLNVANIAGLIQNYTVGSYPVGTFGVQAIVLKARTARGATGPTKIDLDINVGGTDYLSVDKALTLTLTQVQNSWDTNPATTTAWLTSDVFQIGYKSIL